MCPQGRAPRPRLPFGASSGGRWSAAAPAAWTCAPSPCLFGCAWRGAPGARGGARWPAPATAGASWSGGGRRCALAAWAARAGTATTGAPQGCARAPGLPSGGGAAAGAARAAWSARCVSDSRAVGASWWGACAAGRPRDSTVAAARGLSGPGLPSRRRLQSPGKAPAWGAGVLPGSLPSGSP
jgi:hypothetical protein